MKHLNGNVLAVVDIETTGVDPLKSDIIEICVLPLTKTLEPSKDKFIFNMVLKPKKLDLIDFELLEKLGQIDLFYREHVCHSKERIFEVTTNGCEPYLACDLFVEWFEKLQLAPKKRLMPIAHNWPFDRSFLIEWLGPLTFDLVFDPRFRDTMSISLFANDVADWRGEPYPFQKNNLQYLISSLNVESHRAHRALDDCIATAEVFKRMVHQSPTRQVE